jgi:DNA-binding transcriptional LysR family regulator
MLIMPFMSQANASIDPNLLVALDALLTERSVTRAAERLGLTQSAVSHKLKALRDALGDPLLVGGRAGLSPTARALALQEPLRRALADLRAAVERSAPFDPLTSARHFTISAVDYAELVVMPRALDVLRREAPHLTCSVVSPTRELARDLASGAVDLAAGPKFAEDAGLVEKKVLEEGFTVVVRRGHPKLRKAKKLTLDLYLELDHLLVAPRGAPGGVVDDWLAARGLSRRVTLRTQSFVAAPFLTARSDLALTLPSGLAIEALRYVELDLYPPPLPLGKTALYLSWHERSQQDPAHRWMRVLAERAMRGTPMEPTQSVKPRRKRAGTRSAA